MVNEKIEQFYVKNYKKLFMVPIILLSLAILVISLNYARTGDFVEQDVSLKGGVTVSVYSSEKIDINDLGSFLKSKLGKSDIRVRRLAEFGTEKQIGIIIEASEINEEKLKDILEERLNLKLTDDNYSVEEMGSSLGKAFYNQMLIAILLAFLFMAIVVLITFRTWIPSFAVVFAAFSDIVITVAIIDIIGMKLSTSGIAALLMLIGYSVDTDVLSTTRVLKRKEGSIVSRVFDSIKTGLTMTFTTIAALLVGYFVSTSYVIKEIFLIILIGLCVDIITTYLMNAGVLMWYAKKKENES